MHGRGKSDPHSTSKVVEQSRFRGCGDDGGKERGQGQCGPGQHVPDAELGKRVPGGTRRPMSTTSHGISTKMVLRAISSTSAHGYTAVHIERSRPGANTFPNLMENSPSILVADFPAVLLQGGVEAADQDRPIEGLGQEAHCSSLQRSRAEVLVGERRDENERHAMTLGTQND